MEACQTECVLVRIRQIAAGAIPEFEYYNGDGWDFSDRDLRDSLSELADDVSGEEARALGTDISTSTKAVRCHVG